MLNFPEIHREKRLLMCSCLALKSYFLLIICIFYIQTGSPTHERNSSPITSRKDTERGFDDRRKKDDLRDGRSSESYRHSDRQSSRSSRSYHRHDDHHRRDKYADDDWDYSRSLRTGRDSRSDNYFDHSRRETEYRSRDHARDVDKYSRDKSDGQGDISRDWERESSILQNQKHKEKDRLSDRAESGKRHPNSTNDDVKSGQKNRYEGKVSRDDKTEYRRSPGYEDFRSHKSETTSRRESSGHRLKESSRSDCKSPDGEKYTIEEKKSYEDRVKCKDRRYKEAEEQYEDKKGHSSRDQESSVKKPKLFNSDGTSNDGKEGTSHNLFI